MIDTPAIGPGYYLYTFRVLCLHCGVFLCGLNQNTPPERQARLQAMAARLPSQAQLASLQTLGDSGPPPTTMAEASALIDALSPQKGGAR